MSNNVVGIIGATVGIGQYIINDYVITITEAEGDYGYTMTITKGTQTQTVTLYGLTPTQYDAMLGYLEQAQAAAQSAAASSGTASDAATRAETAAGQIIGMTAEAVTLAPGSAATATFHDGLLTLGIPAGETGATGAQGDPGSAGETGNGIVSIIKTGTQGNVDTYTITYTDGTTSTFTVTNSAVVSVAGKTGAVTLDAGDVSFDDQQPYNDGTVGAGLAELKSDLELKSDKATTPGIVEPEETEADLYVCDSDGNVIAKFQDGHIVTKNFDSGAIQFDLIMDTDPGDADLYIADSFGNVVAEFKDGGIITKNFDSGDYADVLSDIDTLQTDVAALQSATSGIMYRTQPFNDGVYAACRFFQSKQNLKQFCILAAGDIHADAVRMNSIIEYLNATQAFDAGIMLGDMSGNTYDSPIAYYISAIANAEKPFLTVIGNHDVGGATSDADLWSKYGACFDYADLAIGEAVNGKCYYHKDFADYKIRMIVLFQYDLAGRSSDDGNLCFGQAQIDWLVNVLNSTPSDYGVIIAEHTNPSRYMTYEMDAAYTSSTWRRSNYAPTVMDGDPIPDIINAWILGGTLTQTYNYTFDNPPAPLSVSADFTARGTGEFITYMGGHWHQDVFGHPTDYPDQPDWHMNCAGTTTAEGGDMGRKIGTLSEDSFCAIAVDREAKTVKVLQIGARFTLDAIDRQYIKYNYGGAN